MYVTPEYKHIILHCDILLLYNIEGYIYFTSPHNYNNIDGQWKVW